LNYLEELIYEAGLDDELFSALPERLAARLGARSCSLLWTSSTSETPLFAHSQYYSEDQLSKYFNEFANHDLWITAASSTQRLNQAWLSSQAIKPDEFASSIFFNEWIRPMGDDTFHALGASMQNAQGSGVIGLHRGKSQGDFRPSHQKALDAAIVHLRRMLSIRSRLDNAERQTGIWREGFVHTPLPTMIIDQSFRIRVRNATAELLLADSQAITEKKGVLWISSLLQHAGLTRILNAAMTRTAPQAGACFARDGEDRIWKAQVLPLVSGSLAGCAMLNIECIEPNVDAAKVAPHLVALFGLTNAEAQIAVSLANGQSVDQIALDRSSGSQTVRSQVKAIMSKLNTHRQSEVASIVNRLR
jgi:DNA-binding CsgD family transcriptional regulator